MGALEGIEQVVVFAGDMTRRGRALVAFCVPAAKDRWDAPALRKAALDVLPPHAVPDHFVLLPEIPRLPTGKADRERLRRLYAASITAEK
jgi:acyl-CoA synthetase (AMP-forming)/AMP-acid ligase II